LIREIYRKGCYGVTKAALFCYIKGMPKLWWVFLFVTLFSACAQTPHEDDDANIIPNSVSNRNSARRTYLYRVDAVSEIAGFSIMVNGAEILSADGGDSVSSKVDINDWMISGNNKIDITIFWPDNVKFSPGISSASFKLFSNNTLIKEFKWPLAASDSLKSYPYTFTEVFKANGFPKVLLENAERVISSAGTLPRADQGEIAEIAQQLRKAFTEKNIDAIDNLLKTKYADLATARFTTAAVVKAESGAKFRELMEKEGYAVYFNNRNSYFSAAEDKAVRLGQGRIGFPEPALIITWRDNKKTSRWTMELYFAKIDGKWVIIR